MIAKIKDGVELSEIEHFVNDEHAEPLYHEGKLVGYVKRAHDVDNPTSPPMSSMKPGFQSFLRPSPCCT